MTYTNGDLDRDYRWLFFGVPLIVLIALLSFPFFRTSSRLTLSNELVYGCYGAPNGAPFRLGKGGMAIAAGSPTLPYHLENAKIGIILAIHEPVDLQRASTGYRFMRSRIGSGRSYPFVVLSGDKAYYSSDKRNFDALHITADDGVGFEYRRQPTHRCSGI